ALSSGWCPQLSVGTLDGIGIVWHCGYSGVHRQRCVNTDDDSLFSESAQRHRWYDGHMDQQRQHGAHLDRQQWPVVVSLDWTRWTIQHDVHVCRLVYLSLHDPSRDGRYGECPVRAPTSTGHRLTLALLFAGSMLGSVMLVAAPVAVRHT